MVRGGRVVDAASRTDRVLDVGVLDGRVAYVGPAAPAARTVVEAAGRVVAPGFIDLHSHAQSPTGHWLQALDGVTTALDLEAGALPVAEHYEEAVREGRPLNFGFSASWALARLQVMGGVDLPRTAPDGTRAQTPLETFQRNQTNPGWLGLGSDAQVAHVLDLLEEAVDQGAIGVGVLLGYSPASGRDEYFRVASLAQRLGVGVFTHSRQMSNVEPGSSLDGALEIISAAAGTGASMHICHVNSTSLRRADEVTAAIQRARSLGNAVTTEAYPYTAASTGIGAAFLAPEALSRLGVETTAIQYLPTGERVRDLDRLRQLRAVDPGGMCIIDYLDEREDDDVAMLLRSLSVPGTVIASDAVPLVRQGRYDVHEEWPVPVGALTHPRSVGTFARSLRWLVRERGAWSMLDAVQRCSYGPARLLEPFVPAMRTKGRVAVGCDADLVVFDPETVTDRALPGRAHASSGFEQVLVNGVRVVRDGVLDRSVRPGRPVRSRA